MGNLKEQKSAQENRRLTIDLRSGCDFKRSHLQNHFKLLIIGYYVFLFALIGVASYDIAKIAIAKKGIDNIRLEEIHLTSQVNELHELSSKMGSQIEAANRLIEWQFDNIQGQKLLYYIFCRLSKELVLEQLSIKRDLKNDHQLNLSITLRGDYRKLHREFETILTRLEELGLMLISQSQWEIDGKIQFRLICQTNFLI